MNKRSTSVPSLSIRAVTKLRSGMGRCTWGTWVISNIFHISFRPICQHYYHLHRHIWDHICHQWHISYQRVFMRRYEAQPTCTFFGKFDFRGDIFVSTCVFYVLFCVQNGFQWYFCVSRFVLQRVFFLLVAPKMFWTAISQPKKLKSESKLHILLLGSFPFTFLVEQFCRLQHTIFGWDQ